MFQAYKTMCSVVPRHEKAGAVLREAHKIGTRGHHEEIRRGSVSAVRGEGKDSSHRCRMREGRGWVWSGS